MLTLEKRPYELPEGWKWVKLKEVTHINKEIRNPSIETPDEEFIYVDISGVKVRQIIETKRIVGKNAPSRARRVIHTNDVLMSTVRPYLKSFALVPKEYDNRICSTGFVVFTCKKDLLPKYLLHTLFSDIVINQCNAMMMGAHYPALRETQISKIKIPLPPLEEQRRIVKRLEQLLTRAEEAKKLRKQAREEAEQIMQAALNKVFSRAEEKGWGWKKLSDISVVVDRDHRTPKYEKGREGIPIISPTNFVRLDDIDLSQTRKVILEEYERDCKRLKIEVGDILYSRIGTIGKARSVRSTEKFTILHSLVLIKLKKDVADSRFIRWILESEFVKDQAYKGIKSIGTPDLGIKIIRSFKIPLPPLKVQKRIAAHSTK